MDIILLFGDIMLYETIHFGNNDYFKKIWCENLEFPSHLHGSFELVLCLEGQTKISVDKQEYIINKNEALLIFPHQIHSYKKGQNKCVLCVFSSKLVSAFYKGHRELKPISNKFTLPKDLALSIINCDENNLTLKKGLLYLACHYFDENREYSNNLNKDFLVNVLIYINDNFAEDCSLETIATKLGYNKSYLSRYFKTSVGINFNEYLNLVRLNNVCYLAENSNDTIINYALSSGFNSVRTFNRNFKQVYGVSPKEYFKNK